MKTFPVRSVVRHALHPLCCMALGSLLFGCSSSDTTPADQGAGGGQSGSGGAGGSGGTAQTGGASGTAQTGGASGTAQTGGASGTAQTGGASGTSGTGGATGGAAGTGGTTVVADAGNDAPAGDSGYDPAKFYWSIATADTMIEKYPNGVPDSYAPTVTWSWENAYFMWGIEKVWRATKQQKYFDYIKTYIDGKIGPAGAMTGIGIGGLDQHLLGYSLALLYEETKDAKYKTAADVLRNHLKTTYPRTTPEGGFWHADWATGQMWIDGGFMGEMFLARYGKTFADTTAFDEVQKQTGILAGHLQIASGNTLFRHAWVQNPATVAWADKTTGVSSEVWSEGQGWHTLLMADVFDWLPADHAAIAALKTQRDKLATGLKANADPNTGMWCQVVDKCTQAGNWNESSGTGMFIYFLQKSINRGYLAAADYQPVVTKAYAGLLTKATNAGGTISVKDISSIGVAANYQAYVSSSKDVNKPSGLTSFMVSSLILELPSGL